MRVENLTSYENEFNLSLTLRIDGDDDDGAVDDGAVDNLLVVNNRLHSKYGSVSTNNNLKSRPILSRYDLELDLDLSLFSIFFILGHDMKSSFDYNDLAFIL